MANTILKVLHAYCSFIENELMKADYKLAKAPPLNKQGIERASFVIPAVTTGSLPHANFSLYGAGNEFFQAPYITVGFDDSGMEFDAFSIQLLIQVCCYSSSAYIQDNNDEMYELDIPDNKAYEDCLNLLEWMQDKFLSTGIIAGTTIERPVRIGSYNSKELTYPYSFGYLGFQVSAVTHEINRKQIKY